ncbi:MAG: excinuclease ABC subunit UvrC [Eubacteriales bacterium]|nr:excinuclease ABC subunit UvrC [Eubacteriales bacterium]
MAEVFDIAEELKKLPASPGVYLMHGPRDEIIYVGKAVNLKNRVRQYFQSSKGKTAKILRMISLIRRFEYIVVDSELEALVLENNLIKEYRPKYNTLLKDDKTYPYIKVSVEEPFPRIYMTRRVKKDRARYFGPYTSGLAVKETIELLHKLFRIRTCSRVLPRDIGKERPCLYHHLGQCDAPCAGSISQFDYRLNVEQALEFLQGKYEPVRKYLTEKMQQASEEMQFEKAIEYRELLKAIAEIATRQKVTSTDTDDRDIIGLFTGGHEAVAQVFFIRDGRLIGRESFHLDVDEKDSISDILLSFIKQFYTGTPYIPKEIWIQTAIEDPELIEMWLGQAKGQRVRIVSPKKGQKEKLVEMAVQNAKVVFERDGSRMKQEEKRTVGAAEELRALLGMEALTRIEAYDISNTNGFESVGSMVVYENGRPKRSDYRKFRIRSVEGPNDYASMREVLTRRFSHGLREREELSSRAALAGRTAASDAEQDGSVFLQGSFTRFPELIMMDGGRGQVNIAQSVLSELGLSIAVCGMVKDDHHRTRGLYFNNEEIPIDTHSEAFRLITRIQDETHRFAIEYHKSLRGKAGVHSVLDDIEGIGTVRRRALMKHFGDIGRLKEASVEELAALPQMNERAAKSVYSFFHGKF